MREKFTIRTARNVEIDYQLATVGDRILARILDTIILFGYIIMVAIGAASSGSLAIMGALIFPALFYSFLFEQFNNGQTPGKNIAKIKVISMDGGNVSASQYFLRWLLLLIDLRLISGAVGIIAILVTDNSQRIGDLVAGTTVVSLKQKMTMHSARKKLNPNYQPKYPQAVNIKAEDISIIEEVLDSKAENRRGLYVMAAAKIEEVYDIKSGMDPRVFLKSLLYDYQYYEYLNYQNAYQKYEEEE